VYSNWIHCTIGGQIDDRWQMTGDRWQVTGDRWQVTGDRWQVTGDRWQVTDEIFSIFLSVLLSAPLKRCSVSRLRYFSVFFKLCGPWTFSGNKFLGCGFSKHLSTSVNTPVRQFGGPEISQFNIFGNFNLKKKSAMHNFIKIEEKRDKTTCIWQYSLRAKNDY
jgi:hypothetical protein